MKFFSIASSSSGNAYIIYENINNIILIDAGISYKKIVNALRFYSINVKNVKYVLITHNHSDHIKGLKTLYKNINPIIVSHKTFIQTLNYEYDCMEFDFFNKFVLDNISICPIRLFHDTLTSGFVFEYSNKKIGFLSDTGSFDKNIIEKMSDIDMLCIEANYSENLIEQTHYPYYLKYRIKSDTGHLSNYQAKDFIRKIYSNKLKKVVFIHLSKNSNSANIVHSEIIIDLKEEFSNIDFSIATYDIQSEIYEI